jgi:hypothetical protein
MSDLGPDARALLDATRHADDPTDADAARIRAKLAARLGAGALAGGVAATVAKSAAAKTGGAAAGAAKGAWAGTGVTGAVGNAIGTAKVLACLALIAAGGAGVASVVSGERSVSDESAPPAGRAAPSSATVKEARVGNPVKAEEPSSPELERHEEPGGIDDGTASAPVAAVAERVRSGVNPRRAAAERLPAPAMTAAPQRPEDLAAELGLVRAARDRLVARDPRGALALVEQHAAQHPRGVLTEEREAARVHALCGLGRQREARSAASEFRGAFPRSPHLRALARSCALDLAREGESPTDVGGREAE